MFAKVLFALFLVQALIAVAKKKGKRTTFWPTAPFVDGCDGLPRQFCLKYPQCGWYTTYIPWCYDNRYIQVKPYPNAYPQSDVAKRFFEYSNGVHLSEGTAQKIYYNTNHEECGDLCIRSPLQPLNVRCLSFDFYEFPNIVLPAEAPKPNRGVCVLNDNSNLNARLRNVDQGYTDEELYVDPPHGGHYRLRLSNFGGHYAVRNPRGGQLAAQLDYPLTFPQDMNKIIIWGKSRWGIAHTVPWEYNPVTPLTASARVQDPLNCSAPWTFPPPPPATTQISYYGGYTPVDENQKCVGMLTKDAASQACIDSGGVLCPTQVFAKSLEGRKLGCSYDGDPVWSEADIPPPKVNQTRFVRCCAKYSYPNFCSTQYTQANINFCNQFLTFKDCQQQGTGYVDQNQWGFGRLLQSYRTACINSNYANSSCVQSLVQDWQPRDQCVWCLQPGTGQGQCRAGADLGICESSSPESRDRFANIINVMCGPAATCRVAAAYPDLACFLSGSCAPVPPSPIVPCASYSNNQPLCNANSEFCEWIPGSNLCLVRMDDGT